MTNQLHFGTLLPEQGPSGVKLVHLLNYANVWWRTEEKSRAKTLSVRLQNLIMET